MDQHHDISVVPFSLYVLSWRFADAQTPSWIHTFLCCFWSSLFFECLYGHRIHSFETLRRFFFLFRFSPLKFKHWRLIIFLPLLFIIHESSETFRAKPKRAGLALKDSQTIESSTTTSPHPLQLIIIENNQQLPRCCCCCCSTIAGGFKSLAQRSHTMSAV